jgi:hypothetical protein
MGFGWTRYALQDDRAVHILEDLAIEAGSSASLGRPLPLIAESDLNDPRLITAREGGGWSDRPVGTTTSTTPSTSV